LSKKVKLRKEKCILGETEKERKRERERERERERGGGRIILFVNLCIMNGS